MKILIVMVVVALILWRVKVVMARERTRNALDKQSDQASDMTNVARVIIPAEGGAVNTPEGRRKFVFADPTDDPMAPFYIE